MRRNLRRECSGRVGSVEERGTKSCKRRVGDSECRREKKKESTIQQYICTIYGFFVNADFPKRTLLLLFQQYNINNELKHKHKQH